MDLRKKRVFSTLSSSPVHHAITLLPAGFNPMLERTAHARSNTHSTTRSHMHTRERWVPSAVTAG